jgi:hypothetical protein
LQEIELKRNQRSTQLMNVKINNLYLLFAISFCFTINSYGQYDAYLYEDFDPLVEDIEEKLPPLDALLDSAVAYSPMVKYQEYKADYYRYEVKSAKIAWTEHFGFQSEINYGHWYFDDFNEGYDSQLSKFVDRNDPRTSWPFYYLESHRMNFSFGLYVRFPLQAITDRRNNINKQKKWVEIELTQRDIEKMKVRENVITMYNQLLQNQKMLRRSQQYQEWTSLQMMTAERQLLDGEISIAEFTRLKEIETRGMLEHEKHVHDFITAYDLLQERTGMKFNLIKEIQ